MSLLGDLLGLKSSYPPLSAGMLLTDRRGSNVVILVLADTSQHSFTGVVVETGKLKDVYVGMWLSTWPKKNFKRFVGSVTLIQ